MRLFSSVCWDLCVWGGCTVSTKCPSSRITTSPHVAQGSPDLTLLLGFTFPTRALPGIELWSFRLCTPPAYRVLMAFKPSPSSFLPFLFSPCSCFHFSTFSSAAFGAGWGVLFLYSLPPSSSSLHKQKQLPALCGFSLSQFTSSCHVPAEFWGSGLCRLLC